MPRNRVQHQKGLSDDAFEQRYPDEEACRKAWFAWRWPEGFKCPRCAWTKYSEIQGRQLLQCQRCRYQTSLIAGTVLQGTKLPMRVWFRAMHLPLADADACLETIGLGLQMDLFVFQAAPQPLDENIVQPAPAAVHADARALGFQLVGKRRTGELCSLVGVKDLWSPFSQGVVEGIEAE